MRQSRGFAYIVESLIAQFEVKWTKEGDFRFCGREYHQGDDVSIKVTGKDNVETANPINYTVGSRTAESKATA